MEERNYMDKLEFLDVLGRVLARELPQEEVLSDVAYYRNYIEQQVSRGRSEEEVLRELGDPRLIARTILDVDQQKEEDPNGRYDGFGGYAGYDTDTETVYTQEADGRETYSSGPERSKNPRSWFGGRLKVYGFGWREWLILFLAVAVIFLVLGTVFAVLWRLLPVILLIWLVLWLYRRFFS